MTELTPHEINLARKRIMRWPRQDRVDLTDLTEPEVELVMLATALLDMRPAEPETP